MSTPRYAAHCLRRSRMASERLVGATARRAVSILMAIFCASSVSAQIPLLQTMIQGLAAQDRLRAAKDDLIQKSSEGRVKWNHCFSDDAKSRLMETTPDDPVGRSSSPGWGPEQQVLISKDLYHVLTQKLIPGADPCVIADVIASGYLHELIHIEQSWDLSTPPGVIECPAYRDQCSVLCGLVTTAAKYNIGEGADWNADRICRFRKLLIEYATKVYSCPGEIFGTCLRCLPFGY